MQTITREQVRGILANELLPDPQASVDRLVYEVAGYPDLDALVDAMEYWGERPTFRMWIEEEASLADLFDAEAGRRGLGLRAVRK